jgi:hypothetical protein
LRIIGYIVLLVACLGVTFGTTTPNSKRLNLPPRELASGAAFDLKSGVESGSGDVTLGITTSNSKRLNSTPRQLASEAAFDLKAGVESGGEKGKLRSKKRRKMKTCSSIQPSSPAPSVMPSKQPTTSRFIAMRKVIGSKYPDRPSFDFDPTTNQYAALELLVKSDPDLVPVPFESNGEYLLLQRYVLVLFYLNTNGDMWANNGGRWLEEEAGLTTCTWSGVDCPDDRYIEGLDCTYNTVKTEPVICNMLTAVFFSKTSRREQPFRKPSY